MVLVDSSVWIEALRRIGDLGVKVGLEALLKADGAVISGPVLLEVLGGSRPRDRTRLLGYFGGVLYRAVPDTAWLRATSLSWQLRDVGVTIPWNDLLIGALGLMWNMRVFAMDQHFDMLETHANLRRYQPGPGGTYADA